MQLLFMFISKSIMIMQYDHCSLYNHSGFVDISLKSGSERIYFKISWPHPRLTILEYYIQGGGGGRVRTFASVICTVILWPNEGPSWSEIVQTFWRQGEWRRFPYALTPSTLTLPLNKGDESQNDKKKDGEKLILIQWAGKMLDQDGG